MGWAVRLAKRVEELHRLGVAHGGVSANIILSDGPSCQGRGVLGDVREAASRPSYHSPERHEGRGISPADDTWGAAVTLYLMLTGHMPFGGTTSDEIRSSIASGNAPPLAVFGAGDDRLQAVLDRFLARSLAHRTTNMGAFRQALERWYPPAGDLMPLEEGEDDSLTDFDDEEVATVMRDFSDVREQLERMGASRPSASRPTLSRQRAPAPAPRPVPTPGIRAPAASAPGFRSPADSLPGMRPPAGSSPGMMSGEVGARPPIPSQSGAPAPAPAPSEPGFAPRAAPSSPGAPQPHAIDDDDSDDEGATLLLDTESEDVQKAIEAALSGATTGRPPGWPSADDDEPDGGQRTIGLAEAGLDFSDVPDPTGGEAAFRPGGPARDASPFRPAPVGFDPTKELGDNPPALDATMAFPEGMEMPGFGGDPLAGPSMVTTGGESDAGPARDVGTTSPSASGLVGTEPDGAPAPVPPPRMYVPEVEDSGGGLRTALIVASVILFLVVIGVVILWLDRAGTIDLPI